MVLVLLYSQSDVLLHFKTLKIHKKTHIFRNCNFSKIVWFSPYFEKKKEPSTLKHEKALLWIFWDLKWVFSDQWIITVVMRWKSGWWQGQERAHTCWESWRNKVKTYKIEAEIEQDLKKCKIKITWPICLHTPLNFLL